MYKLESHLPTTCDEIESAPDATPEPTNEEKHRGGKLQESDPYIDDATQKPRGRVQILVPGTT